MVLPTHLPLSPPRAVEDLLRAVTRWALVEDSIRAVALVGSYARGTANHSSDVDLVILAEDPGRYLADRAWTQSFGRVRRQALEDWGLVTSLRVWYEAGLEVEFGLTSLEWAAEPIDEGTRAVVMGGMRLLLDKGAALASLLALLKSPPPPTRQYPSASTARRQGKGDPEG